MADAESVSDAEFEAFTPDAEILVSCSPSAYLLNVIFFYICLLPSSVFAPDNICHKAQMSTSLEFMLNYFQMWKMFFMDAKWLDS